MTINITPYEIRLIKSKAQIRVEISTMQRDHHVKETTNPKNKTKKRRESGGQTN